MPSSMGFFRDYRWVGMDTPVSPGDEYVQVDCKSEPPTCSNCAMPGEDSELVLCANCAMVGCSRCITQSCPRCAPVQRVCMACHMEIAEKFLVVEARATDSCRQADADWYTKVIQCQVEARWQPLQVLRFPFGKAALPRSMFARRSSILDGLKKAGYPVALDSEILWGNSSNPDLEQAIATFILVIPAGSMPQGRVPIVCKDNHGEWIQPLQLRQTGEQWRAAVLNKREFMRDDIILCGDCEIWGDEMFELQQGSVIQKVILWRQQDGLPQAAFPVVPTQVKQVCRKRDLNGEAKNRVFPNISGYVGLTGSFNPLPRPKPGQTWKEWLWAHSPPPTDDVWASIDGKFLPPDLRLTEQPIIIRLNQRLRGGAKPSARAEASLKKLVSHLQEKGVPADVVEDRANQVLNTIGAPALESVYQSIDPWKSLKTAAQDRVRLVLPEELKAARAKGKPKPGRKAASEGDLWDLDDPWKQGRQLSSSSERPPAEQLQIVIEQGFFLDEEDAPLPVIPHVSAEAKGVAVMSVEEAQTFAQADFVLSEDELGAIVVGNVQPSTHGKHCETVTFPAKHGVQRILLKGFLLQLGTKRVKTQKAQVSIDMPTEEVMVFGCRNPEGVYTTMGSCHAQPPEICFLSN